MSIQHPYLTKRAGRENLYYSRWVPERLQGPGRPKVLNISLGTADPAQALKSYAEKHAEVEALFTRWEAEEPKPAVPTAPATLEKLTTTTLRRLIAEHRAAVVEAELAWRSDELRKARSDVEAFGRESAKRNYDDPYYRMIVEDAAEFEDVLRDAIAAAVPRRMPRSGPGWFPD